MENITTERFYTPEEVSQTLRVSERTIYRWIAKGNLKAVQGTPNGKYRISSSELDRLLGKNVSQ